MAKAAVAKREPRRRRIPTVMYNAHFTPSVVEVIALHSSLTKSGGKSGLTRTIIEYYLATAINWDDPRYRDVERVELPLERYPGQFAKLGLA